MFKQVRLNDAILKFYHRSQPIAFSNAETLYDDLVLLRDQILMYGDLSEAQTNYLNEFIEKFDTLLITTVRDIFEKWLNDGFLVEFINAIINEEVKESRDGEARLNHRLNRDREEIIESRDGETKLNLRLVRDKQDTDNKINLLHNKDDQIIAKFTHEIETLASGSPKGAYETLSDLEEAYPTGAEGIYIVKSSGHWYYYSNGWQDGGEYLDSEISQEFQKLSESYYNNFPITNEIKNSNFLDGRKPWEGYRGRATVEGDTLVVTGDGSSGIVQAMTNITDLGAQYYEQFYVRVRDDECQRIHIFDAGSQEEKTLIEAPVKDQWYEINRAVYWVGGNNIPLFAIRSRYADATVQTGKRLEIRKPLLLNWNKFTGETYRSSDELPDVAYIKSLLSKFPNGHFDGTVNLYTTKEIYEKLSNELKNVVENLPDTLTLAHWKPSVEPTISKNLTYASFITQYYENTLRSEFPNNITRSIVTNDSSGVYPIYKYVFEPDQYTHTAFLIGGIHGDEYEAVWSLYNLLWHVYHKPTTDERLKFVRSNVRLIVIPVANPWGYERGIRHNSNDVDPNRNFDVLRGFEGSVGTAFDQKEAHAIKLVADQYEGEIDLFIDNHTSPPHAGEAGSKYIYTVMRPNSPLVSDAQGELVYFTSYYNTLTNKDLPTYWKYTNNSNSTNYMYMVRGVPALTVEFVSMNFDQWLSKPEMTRAYEWFGNINLKLLNNIESNKVEPKNTLKVYPDLGTDIYRINYKRGNIFEIVVLQSSGATIAINTTPSQTYQTTLLIDCRKSGNIRFNKTVEWSQPMTFSMGNLYQVSLSTFDGGSTWLGTLLGSWEKTYTDVTDNFNRANSDTLGSTVTGGLTWQTHTGTGHKILSNAVVAKATGKQVSALTLPSPDFELSVDIEWRGLGGLIIRGKGTDYYRLTMGTSKLGFYTPEELEIQTIAFTPVIGTIYHFKVRAEGEIIIVFVDGTEVIRYADGDKVSHTEVGLMSFNAPDTKFDNLKIELL